MSFLEWLVGPIVFGFSTNSILGGGSRWSSSTTLPASRKEEARPADKSSEELKLEQEAKELRLRLGRLQRARVLNEKKMRLLNRLERECRELENKIAEIDRELGLLSKEG